MTDETTTKPLSPAMVEALRLVTTSRYKALFKHSAGKWGAYPLGTMATPVEGSVSPLTIKALEARGMLTLAKRSLFAHNDPRIITRAGLDALAEIDATPAPSVPEDERPGEDPADPDEDDEPEVTEADEEG